MSDELALLNSPLLATSGLPDYAAIRADQVVPAVRKILAEATQKLAVIEESLVPTWEGTIARLEELDVPFDYAWKPVGHLFGVLNSEDLRAAYETVLPEIIQFGLRASQSEPIYRAIKALRDGPEWQRLTPARQRIIEDRIRTAELSGIALSGAERTRFNEIEQELSQLATDFANHVLDATKAFGLEIHDIADTQGWPSTLRNQAARSWSMAHPESPAATPDAGPWRVTLEHSLFGPFMEHCRNRTLREQLYRALVMRASSGPLDNSPLISRILALRLEKARLLGYQNYAEVSLKRKMAPNVAAIERMFEQLREAAWEPAHRDLEELRAFCRAAGETAPLELWDVAFWSERRREALFSFTDEELRPYFPLETVLDGLFQLLHRLFGITVRQSTGISVWHPDVRHYSVFDESGTPLASFYLDPYSRPENKRSGAWMDVCLGRQRVGETVRLPVAHLVCNQTPPYGTTPSLMSFREVETLFHEMGHGLQHMLTRIDDADAAGINGIEWDAVELPSQFMENWCYHRPTLMSLTGHYQTGEKLPEALYEKLKAAKNYQSGLMLLRQLRFGMTDMELHTTYDPNGSETPFDVNRRISALTSVLPILPEDRSLCSFQHIFSGGYAAGYYSYKWSEILSADAFGAFEEAGLDDPEHVASIGRRFRDTVLALGGSQPPMDVFRAFRGREPSPEALLRHAGLLPASR